MNFTDFIFKLAIELETHPNNAAKALRKVVREFDQAFKAEYTKQFEKNERRKRHGDPDDEIPF